MLDRTTIPLPPEPPPKPAGGYGGLEAGFILLVPAVYALAMFGKAVGWF